jgi:hypothetical protein
MRSYSIVLMLVLATPALRAADEMDWRVIPPPAELELDPFYKKYISANGYPIVASEKVSDHALREAAYLVNMMLAKRPDVREAMVKSGSRLIVMAHNEFTTDVPEHSRLRPKEYWDARARGLGGSQTDPVCSCGEENLLGFPGDPYSTESILIHEFAHNIHLRGMVNLDTTFDERLKKAYDDAMAQGLWKGKYASVNHHEYFAEGVQSWFDNNRPPDHDHNHVDTRDELIEYDPGLARLCEEVFGDTELVYTKPATRLHGHLEGFDPEQAPHFVWPEHLAAAKAEIRRKAEERSKAAERQPIEHEERRIEGWTVVVDKRLLEGSHQELGDLALRIVANELFKITQIVDEGPLAKLQEVPIWLELDHPLKSLQYHPDAKWLKDHGYDEGLTKAVHVPQAERLLKLYRENSQPAVFIHELAHAYHDRVLGFDYEPIVESYKTAAASGRYESVLHVDGDKRRHYALTNHKEFFAEMSESFLSTNDFYPFVRGELQDCDRELYQLLESIWRPTAD